MNSIIQFWAATLILACHCTSTQSQAPLPVAQWPAGVAARTALPTARAIDYEFSNVDVDAIESWLSWIGIELPVSATGNLSGWLWAQRGSSGWLTFKDYRVEGYVSSPVLQLDNYIISSAALRFGYANNRWYVGQLSGAVKPTNSDAVIGHVRLAAQLPLDGAQPLETSGAVDGVNLGPLLQSLGVDIELDSAGGLLTFAGTVPLAQASDLRAWTANAKLQLDALTFQDLPPADLSATAELAQGAWSIADGTVNWLAQPVRVAGNGQLLDNYPYRFSVNGRELSISQTLQTLGLLELASQLAGQVNLQASLQGDAQQGITAADFGAQSPIVKYQAQQLSQVDIRGNYLPQSIMLTLLQANYAGGVVKGTSQWTGIEQLAQGFPSSVKLSLADLQLTQLPDEFRPLTLRGVASGQISVQSEARAQQVLWSTQGNLSVSDFSLQATTIGDVQLQCSKTLEADWLQLDLKAGNQSINSQLTIKLEDTEQALRHVRVANYEAVGRVQQFQTEMRFATRQVARVPVLLTGNFDLQGTPENWLQSGRAKLDRVATELAGEPIELREAVLHVSRDEFRLEQFTVVDPRGRIAGAAIIRRDGAQLHRFNLRIIDASLTAYSDLLSNALLKSFDGLADLELRLTKAANSSDWRLGWEGSIAAQLRELVYRGVPIGRLSLDGQLAAEQVDARLDGDVFAGQANLSVKFPLTALSFAGNENSTATKPPVFNFEANLIGIEIGRALAMVINPRRAALLSGTANFEASGQLTSTAELSWEARLRIPNMLHAGQPLARDFFLNTDYATGQLQIHELSGGVAGGRIDARGAFPIKFLPDSDLATANISSGELRFDAQRIQLDAFMDFLFPQYADQFSGVISYRGTARYNRLLNLTGDAHANDAIAFGLPIQRGHGNLKVSFNNDGSLAQLVTHNLTGTAIGGRFVGGVDLRGGSRYQLSAHGRVTDGRLDQLSRGLGFEHILGKGCFDGVMKLDSRNASSLAALTGQLQIDFDRGDAQSVPLLPELARFVPVLQLASTDITDGILRARIGQGQLRIQDLFLNSDSFWMVGQGNASLLGGQLDIEAVLQTGGGIDQQVTQQAIQRLALGLLPQVALLTEINDLLRNRSLYFHIGGTTNQPVVQARVAQTLGKALLQNIGRSLLGASPAAAADSN